MNGGPAGGPTGAMRAGSLRVRDLAFAYPDGRQALFGVNLDVSAGERVAILGPNGAGKTTLVLHLNGTLTAGAGSVTVDGLTVGKPTLREVRRRVGTWPSARSISATAMRSWPSGSTGRSHSPG